MGHEGDALLYGVGDRLMHTRRLSIENLKNRPLFFSRFFFFFIPGRILDRRAQLISDDRTISGTLRIL
eukprot:SAG11_NODE_11081_length_785_cov_0.998542_2_plen_67_part_01